MGIILWIIFGAIAGWLASVLMKTNSSQGAVSDILMGIIGAVVSRFLMGLVGQPGVTGFNLFCTVCWWQWPEQWSSFSLLESLDKTVDAEYHHYPCSWLSCSVYF